MNPNLSYNYLEDFTNELQRNGRYSFSIEEIRAEFNANNEALKKSIQRLSKKGKILTVRKGFYLIIPPEYSYNKVLPPMLFIDQLMKYLEKPYYIGLLNAAALFGAAHQQPQEFFVITIRPPLRSIKKNNIKVNFIIKSKVEETYLVNKKTDTGYIRVSCPELTAIDLLIYEERVGGLHRCFTILNELSEEMKPAVLKQVIQNDISVRILQRLGYLLEMIKPDSKLSIAIYDVLKDRKFRYIQLKTGKSSKGFSFDKKWKIIKNFNPESDL